MRNAMIKYPLMTMLLLSSGLSSCQQQTKKDNNSIESLISEEMKNTDKKYYELVFIWVKNPDKFQEYGQKVGPIVQQYGGEIDKMFAPSSIYAEGMEQPHIVNLVHYESKEAYTKFENDSAFKKIEHLRDESINMMSFRGYLDVNNPSFENLAERVYNIELANYKDNNPDAYKKYESQGESKMKGYGFNVEFKLDIQEQTSTLANQPDFAKISFFNNSDSMSNFEKDPTHKLIEEKLYPEATQNVIWISGAIHPMMLHMMENHGK